MPPQSRLLSLPAEIQGMIFDFVLIEDEPIDVTDSRPLQPGLLRVNRSIRHNFIRTYYSFNRFIVNIDDYDFEKVKHEVVNSSIYFQRPRGAAPDFDLSHGIIGYTYGGSPNWGNLVRWLEAEYDDEMPPFDNGGDLRDVEGQIIEGVFNVCWHLALNGNGWDQIKASLGGFRAIGCS